MNGLCEPTVGSETGSLHLLRGCREHLLTVREWDGQSWKIDPPIGHTCNPEIAFACGWTYVGMVAGAADAKGRG